MKWLSTNTKKQRFSTQCMMLDELAPPKTSTWNLQNYSYVVTTLVVVVVVVVVVTTSIFMNEIFINPYFDFPDF
jgi:hypothetical protein